MNVKVLNRMSAKVSSMYFVLVCLLLLSLSFVAKSMVDKVYDFGPDPYARYEQMPVVPLMPGTL